MGEDSAADLASLVAEYVALHRPLAAHDRPLEHSISLYVKQYRCKSCILTKGICKTQELQNAKLTRLQKLIKPDSLPAQFSPLLEEFEL